MNWSLMIRISINHLVYVAPESEAPNHNDNAKGQHTPRQLQGAERRSAWRFSLNATRLLKFKCIYYAQRQTKKTQYAKFEN